MKRNLFRLFSVIIFIIVILLLTLICYPLIKSYNNPISFNAYIQGFGVWGFVNMFFIQVAQIIVAVIPGEIIEFVAGTLYGPFFGTAFCCLGITVGQFLIFKIVKTFGKGFVEKVAGSKFMAKYNFLTNEKKLKTLLFILFILPCTPKDLLSYVVPLTKIKLKDFLIITLIARLPSVASSAYAGYAFAEKNFLLLALSYAVILVFTLVGLLIYKFFVDKSAK